MRNPIKCGTHELYPTGETGPEGGELYECKHCGIQAFHMKPCETLIISQINNYHWKGLNCLYKKVSSFTCKDICKFVLRTNKGKVLN